MRKLTQEEVEKYVADVSNDEYTVLSEYINANTPIKIKHKKCGEEYMVTFNNFYYQGNRCQCQNKYRAKPDSFYENEFHKQLNGRDLMFLRVTRGVDSTRPYEVGLDVRCNICNSEFNMTFAHFERGDKCSCLQKNRRKSDEEWSAFFHETYENKCDIIELNRDKNYIKFKCKKCGKEDYIALNQIYRVTNWQCFCENHFISGKQKLFSEWEQLFYAKADKDFYKLLSLKKIGEKYHFEFMYLPTSEIFYMQPDNFYNYFTNGYKIGKRGRKVQIISWGEIQIKKFLEEKNIVFQEQYKFSDCKIKRCLRFDFAVFDNNNLKCLIEFDGQQHFGPVQIFGGEHRYLDTVESDTVKNKYCEKNHIKLIRIPYWDYDNIEHILTEELGL